MSDTIAHANLAGQVAAVRRFDRFYSQKIGALNERLLGSRFSLAEVRVLFELAHRGKLTAAALARALGLDQGYLSRILARFASSDLISRSPSAKDGRQSDISLTLAGNAVFAPLDAAADDEVAQWLGPLGRVERSRLVAAMGRIERLLGDAKGGTVPYLLRSPRAGDYGWVIHRQGVLYAAEYGWDATFEALVVEIVAQFVKNFDPTREGCWLAEREGEIVGSIFLVRESDRVAKLRLLYVEPEARGMGIGRRLVSECIAAARRDGYDELALWTNDVLVSARRIYQAAGFELEREERHHSFGKDLNGQFWRLRV